MKTESVGSIEPTVCRSDCKVTELERRGAHTPSESTAAQTLPYICGLRLFNYPGLTLFDDTPEIVFLLRKAFWGMGLAAEAARACLRYGFEQPRSALIVAMTRSENIAAQRVLERIGMKYKSDVRFMDFDCIVYTTLPEEFQLDDFLYTLHDPS